MAAWRGIARLLMLATFGQSFLAGVYLSGEAWGRDLHRALGFTIAGIAIVVAVIAIATLHDTRGDRRFALGLAGFAVMAAVQLGLGIAAAEGTRTLWLHLPLGVALVGTAANLEVAARSVGQPSPHPDAVP
jgi:hypothetical protein